MPRPEGDNSTVQNLILSNGTFAIIELNAVNPGTLDALTEEERVLTEEKRETETKERDQEADTPGRCNSKLKHAHKSKTTFLSVNALTGILWSNNSISTLFS